jgi:RimJ/RimL family protein N-acetyltransferase
MVLATARLRLRHLRAADSPFILALVNDPDWIRFIGDRGVRTVDDARGYIERGPMQMYSKLGFGLYLVELKDGTPIGLCGLIKRATLHDVDIGFAFMPAFRGRGYAQESALAVRDYATGELGLERIVAITDPGNEASAKLLGRLGFEYERTIAWGTEGAPSRLFGFNAPCQP